MARGLLMLIFAAVLAQAQQNKPAKEPAYEEPKEEDATSKPKEYVFNPVQAENEIKIGKFYLKKGSFKAAAARFEEASRWNPQSGEAFLLWGEASERLKDFKAARAAYEKYLELAPDAKDAGDVKKRLSKLPAPKSSS